MTSSLQQIGNAFGRTWFLTTSRRAIRLTYAACAAAAFVIGTPSAASVTNAAVHAGPVTFGQGRVAALSCQWTDGITVVVRSQIVHLILSCTGGNLVDKLVNFTWTGIPVGGSIDNSGRGNLFLIPFLDTTPGDSVTITAQVCDTTGCGPLISRVIRLIDQRPVLQDDEISLSPGGTATVSLLANDRVDASATMNPFSVVLQGGEATASGQLLDGVTLSWDANAAVATVQANPDAALGTRSFSYRATDSLNRTAARASAITVRLVVPPPPVAVNDAMPTVTARSPGLVSAIANDSSSSLVTSLDLDVTLPGQQKTVLTAAGQWTAGDDGSVAFVANAGFSGTASVGYTVTDSYGQVSNEATVTIFVGRPPLPAALADRATATAGASVVVDVLANDHANGVGNALDPATLRLHDGSESLATSTGRWSVVGGRVLWSGTQGYVGTATLEYTVQDIYGQSTAAAVTIEVMAPPPPRASSVAWRTGKRQGITAFVWDPLLSDPSTKFTFIASDGRSVNTWQSADGIASINGDGSITLLPSANFVGSLSIPFRLTDQYGGSASAGITLVVVSEAIPTARFDTLSFATITPLAPHASANVTANDIAYGAARINPASITVTPVSGGDASAWTTLDDGRVNYAPPAGFVGTARAVYSVRDTGGLESNTASLSATVVAASASVGVSSAAAAESAVAVPTLSQLVMWIMTAIVLAIGVLYPRWVPVSAAARRKRTVSRALPLATLVVIAICVSLLAPRLHAQMPLTVSGTSSTFAATAGTSTASSFVYNNGHRCAIFDSLVLCDYSIDLLAPVANVPSVSPNLNCRQAPAFPGNVPPSVATTLRLDVLCDSNGLGYSYSGTDIVGTPTTLTKAEIVTSVTLTSGGQKTYTLTVCSRLAPASCDQFFWIVRAGGNASTPAPSGCTLLANATSPAVNQIVSFVVAGCSDAVGATYSFARGGTTIPGTSGGTANFAPLPTGTSAATVTATVCTTAGCQSPVPSLSFGATAASGFTACLDVDGDGIQRASADGMVLMRLMLGIRGQNALVGAIAPGAPRATWAAVSAHLSACGWPL